MLIRILLWALLLVCPSVVQAANTTLGNLAAGSAVSGTDLFYDVQTVGAGGVKVTGTQLGTFLWALGGATTSSSTATFSSSALLVKGSSTGTTAFASANAGASNFTLTFPAATDQLIARATTDTLTNKTYDTAGTGNVFKINGTGITAISGNTATLGSASGAFVSGNCVKTDASHNLIDAATTCGGGGGLTVNTTTVSGGAAGNYLYTDGTLLQASTGVTWVGTGQQLNALGTITTNLKALNITGTWNAVGTTFDAPLFVNITNTASAANSKVMDIQAGGVSQLAVSEIGASSASYSLNGPHVIQDAGSNIALGNPDNTLGGSGTGIQVGHSNIIAWSTGTAFATLAGPGFYVDTAGATTVALADLGALTTGVGFHVYNTTDTIGGAAPTNYERGIIDWSTTANSLTIGTQASGTGTARTVNFISGGARFNFGVGAGTNAVIAIYGNTASNIVTGNYSMLLADTGTPLINVTNGVYQLASGIGAGGDTGISRASAGVIDIGNGALQDTSGTIVAAHATLNALANVATTSAVCYNTGTGVLTYDGTIGTCNTSTMRVKHNIRPLAETQPRALEAVMAMRPATFFYNDEQHTPGQQIGLMAEDMAKIDSRLVAYDEEGKPVSIRYLGPMFSYLIAAIQQQQHEIDGLRARR